MLGGPAGFAFVSTLSVPLMQQVRKTEKKRAEYIEVSEKAELHDALFKASKAISENLNFRQEVQDMNKVVIMGEGIRPEFHKKGNFPKGANFLLRGFMNAAMGANKPMGLAENAPPFEVDLATRIYALAEAEKKKRPDGRVGIFAEIDYFKDEPCPEVPSTLSLF